MAYQGRLNHIVYPDESANPCALQYRIVFMDEPKRLAIVQMFDPDAPFLAPSASSNVRDQILNRILDGDLKGVPLNAIRQVVTTAAGHGMYGIEVDVDDYVQRGNPYEASHVAATGLRVREPSQSARTLLLPAARACRRRTRRPALCRPNWPTPSPDRTSTTDLRHGGKPTGFRRLSLRCIASR